MAASAGNGEADFGRNQTLPRDALLRESAGESASREPTAAASPMRRWILPALNLLAAMHIVWFYVYRVPSYMNLDRYEAGIERLPFQQRILMQYPLRWAHRSAPCIALAEWITRMHVWLSRPIVAEDVVQAWINLAAVLAAGLVARELYRVHSRSRLLMPFVFPLFLVMVAGSYCLGNINFFRYFYDLPSLGLLSVGYFLIVRRAHPALFALLFVVATVNRETSLFLLYFFLASACIDGERIDWRRALRWRSGGTVVLLSLFWLGWHAWILRHFSGLHFETGPGPMVNFACLLLPLTWPQIAGIGGYSLAILLVYWRKLPGAELRLWLGCFPIWFAFMMYFGDLIELRIFGELLPIFAAATVLLADEYLDSVYRRLPSRRVPTVAG